MVVVERRTVRKRRRRGRRMMGCNQIGEIQHDDDLRWERKMDGRFGEKCVETKTKEKKWRSGGSEVLLCSTRMRTTMCTGRAKISSLSSAAAFSIGKMAVLLVQMVLLVFVQSMSSAQMAAAVELTPAPSMYGMSSSYGMYGLSGPDDSGTGTTAPDGMRTIEFPCFEFGADSPECEEAGGVGVGPESSSGEGGETSSVSPGSSSASPATEFSSGVIDPLDQNASFDQNADVISPLDLPFDDVAGSGANVPNPYQGGMSAGAMPTSVPTQPISPSSGRSSFIAASASSSSSAGLGAGAIVGICVTVISLVGVAVSYSLRRSKRVRGGLYSSSFMDANDL